MSLINPIFAPTVEFSRPTETAYGAVSFTTLGSNQTVVSLQAPADSGGGEDFRLAGLVFTPRGLDRKHGDRFTHNGQQYELFGPARGDQDQPFTGDNFGWISHAIRRSN
jgi:hypothetical protein